VHTIADWLKTGASSDRIDREYIASLGNETASQREMNMLADRLGERPDKQPSSRPNTYIDPRFHLSVDLITRLNLWWSEATRIVLVEEASRLKISTATLDETCDMVVKSCNSSLILMAKQFDAEIESLYERLSYLALHDSLTGLVNRATLVDWLNRAIVRLNRQPGGLAVAFMDLDNFKDLNDAYGHACGDEVLVEMASRLAAQMRTEDVVSRFGGDEFVAIFGDLSDPLEEARGIAERLRSIASEPVKVNGEDLKVTVSIGIAVVEGPGSNADEVLARADSAMYSGKKTGRNNIVTI
jgi:diguanylate cyclase (GGDEF)-like protein